MLAFAKNADLDQIGVATGVLARVVLRGTPTVHGTGVIQVRHGHFAFGAQLAQDLALRAIGLAQRLPRPGVGGMVADPRLQGRSGIGGAPGLD